MQDRLANCHRGGELACSQQRVLQLATAAVGATLEGRDLGFLRVDRTFSQTLAATRGPGESVAQALEGEEDARKLALVEQWTATQAIVQTRRPTGDFK